MDINEKRYPYPVLKPGGDDYGGSVFDVAVTYEAHDDVVRLLFRPTLRDDGLRNLILNEKKAEIVCHIESPQTAFRRAFRIDVPNCETARDEETQFVDLPTLQVAGPVSVCPFIIATDDVIAYSNPAFHPDYDREAVNVYSGGILAEGTQQKFNVDTARSMEDHSESAIAVMSSNDEKLKGMRVMTSERKITIVLPVATFARYRVLQQGGRCDAQLRAMIFVPAIAEVLSKLLREKSHDVHMAEYASCRWYRPLDALMRKTVGYGFDAEEFSLELSSASSLAAAMMDDPLERALEELACRGSAVNESEG